MSEKLKRHLCRIGQPHIAAFSFGEYHGRATNIQLEGLTPKMADDVKAALERDPALKMSGYFVEQDACQGSEQSWMIVFFREGANKSYGTRAFTGNPLILND